MSYSNYDWMTDEEVVREVESWEEPTPMEQELAARLDQAIQEIWSTRWTSRRRTTDDS